MLATNKNAIANTWGTDFLFICLTLSFFYVLWLGAHPLLTPDEGRYTEVAREMVASGDYITPRLNGVVFFDKPILYYWLQTIAIKLFGLNEWGLRVWPAALGILGCLTTYIAGRLLFNRRTGILAGFILATNPLYYGAAHYANLDLEVSVLISSSLFCSIIGLTRLDANKNSFFSFVAAYFFAALAILTKGLIGLLFPMTIIGLWILVLNRWSVLKKMHLLIGTVIIIGMISPWFVWVQKANPQFFHFFFVTQQFSRFVSHDSFNNQAAWWYYLPIVFGGFFPWSVFLIQALTIHCRKVFSKPNAQSIDLFLLLWIGFIFLFFSIPLSKTMGYILPIFPAIALLIATTLDRVWDQTSIKSVSSGIVILIVSNLFLGIFCLIAPYMTSLKRFHDSIPYALTAALVFLSSALVFSLLIKNKPKTRIYFYTALITAILLLLVLAVSSTIMNQKSLKPMAIVLKPLLRPTDEVVTYYKYYQDLPVYLERRMTVVADWQNPTIPQRDNWLRELWYGIPYTDTSAWLINENTFWQRWSSNSRLYVFIYQSDWDSFANKAKESMHTLAESNHVRLVTNDGLGPFKQALRVQLSQTHVAPQ